MSMYHNQKVYKAKHGGYRDKPTKGQVNGLLDLYAGIASVKINIPEKATQPPGTQLKLKL